MSPGRALPRFLAVVALGALAAPPARCGETVRIDDSASLPGESTTLLRWRQFAPTQDTQSVLEGAVAVALRLSMAPVLNRSGRLYLVLPEQGTTPVRVRWTTQGRLLPGEISPGQRVIVFQGPIVAALLEDTLLLDIEADGNHLPGMQRLEFHFEFEAD
jgi:hypothetical protein